MKHLILTSLLILFSSAISAQPLDLEANMKKMGLAYKQSVKAQNAAQMLTSLNQLEQLVITSKTAHFSAKTKSQSIEGLNKVLAQIKLAKSHAEKQEINQAKQALKTIDLLRKKYHKIHEPPSFWQLIFGD